MCHLEDIAWSKCATSPYKHISTMLHDRRRYRFVWFLRANLYQCAMQWWLYQVREREKKTTHTHRAHNPPARFVPFQSASRHALALTLRTPPQTPPPPPSPRTRQSTVEGVALDRDSVAWWNIARPVTTAGRRAFAGSAKWTFTIHGSFAAGKDFSIPPNVCVCVPVCLHSNKREFA